eukprot:scaffold34276_cov27-Tisochrysis_lutea.AAC.1
MNERHARHRCVHKLYQQAAMIMINVASSTPMRSMSRDRSPSEMHGTVVCRVRARSIGRPQQALNQAAPACTSPEKK